MASDLSNNEAAIYKSLRELYSQLWNEQHFIPSTKLSVSLAHTEVSFTAREAKTQQKQEQTGLFKVTFYQRSGQMTHNQRQ